MPPYIGIPLLSFALFTFHPLQALQAMYQYFYICKMPEIIFKKIGVWWIQRYECWAYRVIDECNNGSQFNKRALFDCQYSIISSLVFIDHWTIFAECHCLTDRLGNTKLFTRFFGTHTHIIGGQSITLTHIKKVSKKTLVPVSFTNFLSLVELCYALQIYLC